MWFLNIHFIDKIRLFINCANRSFTLFAASEISECESLFGDIPAARFEISDIPTICIPSILAVTISGTEDIPTASTPIFLSIRISAGVS